MAREGYGPVATRPCSSRAILLDDRGELIAVDRRFSSASTSASGSSMGWCSGSALSTTKGTAHDLEGIVAKFRHTPYAEPSTWVKVKTRDYTGRGTDAS